jgi:WD40 repeat protein
MRNSADGTDGHVYVWQTATGQTTEVLMGHNGSVNAVAWNPKRTRRIFASCGDDKTM